MAAAVARPDERRSGLRASLRRCGQNARGDQRRAGRRRLSFQLYSPEGDDVSAFDRADALAGWVNHFCLPRRVTQPKLDKVTGETGEAIDDLRNIAQLGWR